MGRRRGLLWEGVIKISPIDSGAYLLARCRYLELKVASWQNNKTKEVG